MTTGLWILFWVLVSTGIAGILLLTANRKPVEAAREPADDVCAQMRRQMPYRPEPSPLNYNYLADIYPQTGECPKPLTGIQEEAIEREFAVGSTAAPNMVHVSEVADWPTPDIEKLQVSDISPDSIMVMTSVSNPKPFFAEKLKAERHPSVKSKTPVAKKKAPAKKAKPVAKKRATKKD